MQLQHIKLEDLKTTALNVRKVGATDIADLEPSIRSLGVLQPLLVRPNCEGFEVVAGQRRFHALTKIAEDTPVTDVPCIVMADDDDAKAIEASLAENVARLPMDEIDQYKAFAALVKQGQGVEDIAAQFGITERLVRQRLALASLLPPILTAYRKGEIEAHTLRVLTMASKNQQKAWLTLLRDDDEYAPQGHRLKQWLFGGQNIATSVALFDLDGFEGTITSDLFGDEAYFDNLDLFWAAQNAAISQAKERYLAEGWAEVIILEVGEHFPSYDYVDTAKENGGKIYVRIANNGEVTFFEGQLSRKETAARERAAQGGKAEAMQRPELTKAMQSYLDLHRHAAVRAELLNHQGVALRLAVAQMIAGSDLMQAHADPQHTATDAVAQSLGANKGEQVFSKARHEVLALLGMDEADTLVPRKGDWHVSHNIHVIFAKLVKLTDAEVSRILTFVVAEILPCGSVMVEGLAGELDVDMAKSWEPDQAFFDLLRDKPAINAMLQDVGGKVTADAHVTSTAKVQKGIIQDYLNGTRAAGAKDWYPRYMQVPMAAYTKRGGIVAIDNAKAVK